MSRRIAAVFALLFLGIGLILLVAAGLRSFPRGLIALVLVVLALLVAWQGLVRRGRPRVVSWIVAAILVVGAVGGLVIDGILIEGVAGIVLVVLSVVLAKRAFSVHLHLPPAPPPQHAVVVWNPKSGGGKALKQQPRRRGPEARDRTDRAQAGRRSRRTRAGCGRRGADGLMAAGGDGTQALVATIAAEHDLPFACIPAGTRNHFALDLGVDRNDVVGALEAFVDGGEKRVDLGEVGGRTFVNNVSLGLYAEAVQSDGYRDAKIRTILDTVPTMLSKDPSHESTRELRWTGPDGRPERSAAVILVSNNVYRLGRVMGSGTRSRMDGGVLGVTVVGAEVAGREPPEREERVGRRRSSSSSPRATSLSESTVRRW